MSADLVKWVGAGRAKAVILVLAVGLAGAVWAGCGSDSTSDSVNSIQEQLEEKADEAQGELEKSGEQVKEGLEKGSEEAKKGVEEGGSSAKNGIQQAK